MQAILGSSKPENKPVGSANAIFDNDSDSDGFCAAEEEEVIVCNICANPDPYLDNNWDVIQAKVEITGKQSDMLESVEDGPNELDNEGECHDPAPIFHFPPPPQVIPTMPSPPVTQPARAQQAPVRRQSPASIPLPPSPLPMDICPPSPPHPTLAHLMPQSDVPNLVDAYMQTLPSSPKAKYLWEAFNRAKEYASEEIGRAHV